MNTDARIETRNPKTERPDGNSAEGRVLVTRLGLAVALGVSLRTVDRMLAAGDIVPVRIHRCLVRFYVPDVIECLRRGENKWGREADTNFTNLHEGTEQ